MTILDKHGLKTILLISLVYAGLAGYGIYGFSNDFHFHYNEQNVRYESWREYGIMLATLSIYGKHLGVYLTSFFLAFSSGVLLQSFFKIKSIESIIFFLFIFIVILHTHPIIMSTSGAMRQGWTMIFIFFSFSFHLKEKYILSFIMILISVFMHKSGLFFFAIYLLTIFCSFFQKRLKQKKFFLLISSLILCSIIFIFISQNLDLSGQRIIGGDFRFLWGIINISYIFFYFYFYNFLSSLNTNKLSLFMYFFSFFAFTTVISGFTYFYERLNMVMAIPYILILSSYIKKDWYYFVLSFIVLIYLVLTMYQGMYTIGLT